MSTDDDRPAVIPSAVDPDVECVRIDAQGVAAPPDGGTAAEDTPKLCPDGYVPRRRSPHGYTLRGKSIVSPGPPLRNPNPAPAQGPSPSSQLAAAQPISDFLRAVAATTYDDIRAMPDRKVQSASAFQEMKDYLRERYDRIGAVTSLTETDGQVIDCIPDERHPAVQHSGVVLEPPGAQPTPTEYSSSTTEFAPPSDPDGAGPSPVADRYPRGTLPVYRTTLEQLARFPNLAAFNAKHSAFSGVAAPAAPAFPKRYATGEQDVHCLGGSSYVNVWKPFVTPTFQSTFSQHWYAAGLQGTQLQTVECGWHVDIARYGNAEPHLFVYATRNTYADADSFYNQEGNVYQPVANPYVLPGAPLASSVSGGAQIAYKMGFYLANNAWWFYFADQPVGYIPLNWFQGGPITSGAERIRFGGEVGSLLPGWPSMGSGQHAAAGYGKAAYQREAFFNPVAGGAAYATLSEAGSVTGTCYSVIITNNSGAADWNTYLYFGGPGGQGC